MVWPSNELSASDSPEPVARDVTAADSDRMAVRRVSIFLYPSQAKEASIDLKGKV
jgi:hypothetical protein